MTKKTKKTKKRAITVFFGKTRAPEKTFNGEAAAREWIMGGLMGCEGAERDHYVSLLQQLEMGLDRLDYDS